MTYYVGLEREEFIPNIYIGAGSEGRVYYNPKTQEAIKIFYLFNGYDANMDEMEALKMSKIETKYILLPRRLVYDERGIFMGYTTPFIRKSWNMKEEALLNYPSVLLRYLLAKLYKDTEIISKHRLIINDILNKPDNYIFNGSFYLVDPGYYYFCGNSEEIVKITNFKRINNFLCETVLNSIIPDLSKELSERGLTYTLCDYLKDEVRPNETLMNLVRRK